MSEKRSLFRAIVVLLVFTLLPFGPFAGMTIPRADAEGAGYLQFDRWEYDGLYSATVYWDVAYDDDLFELKARLFRVRGETETELESPYLSQDEGRVEVRADVPPGDYRVVLQLIVNGAVIDEDSRSFSLSGVPLTVYLFGADEGTVPELYYFAGEFDIQPSSVEPGNGFRKYVFEVYPGSCHDLLINGDTFESEVCSHDRLDYIYSLTASDYMLDWYNYDLDLDGNAVSGRIAFGGPEYNYRLSFYHRDGELAAVCRQEAEQDNEFEYYNKFENIECPLPFNVGSLVIEAKEGDDYHPTDFVLPLGDIGPLEVVSMVDDNPNAEETKLTVQFKNDPLSESEADIVLYKVTTDNFGFSDRYWYVPADGGGPYNVTLAESYVQLLDNLYIKPIASNGREYLTTVVVPMIDNIRNIAPVDFRFDEINCDIDDNYYCGDFLFKEDIVIDPADAEFADQMIGWSVPDTGGMRPVKYDLYFVDGDKAFIRGEARVPQPEGQSTFRHLLPDIPEGAAYVAVVPLLTEYDAEGYWKYYARPFFIDLAPRLDLLRVDGFFAIQDESDPHRYTAYVDRDATEAVIEAASASGIVLVNNGEYPEQDGRFVVPIDVPQKEFLITVKSSDDALRIANYTLTIIQRKPGSELVVHSVFIDLGDDVYGYVPGTMTAAGVRMGFEFEGGTDVMVIGPGNKLLEDMDRVTPGTKLVLTHESQQYEIGLRFLSELLLPGQGNEPVTIYHVAKFVVDQLKTEEAGRTDLTGDHVFDKDDIRKLLEELIN